MSDLPLLCPSPSLSLNDAAKLNQSFGLNKYFAEKLKNNFIKMANLQKIKDLSKAQNIPLKSIAEQIGITEVGLHKMIREETMSVVRLEQIARIFNANICVFFDTDIQCGHFEQYNATAERAIAANKIGKVDQRNMPPKSSSNQSDLEAQVIKLQGELLEAKDEIIKLMKGQKK